jgi:hypothetical protein
MGDRLPQNGETARLSGGGGPVVLHEHFELVRPVNGAVAIEFTIRNSAPIESDEDMWSTWTGRTLRHISTQNVSGASDHRLGGDREAGGVEQVGEGETEYPSKQRFMQVNSGSARPGRTGHGQALQLAPSRTRSRLVSVVNI